MKERLYAPIPTCNAPVADFNLNSLRFGQVGDGLTT